MPLDITEYSSLARSEAGHILPAGVEPRVAHQQVAIGAGSVQSAVFNESTKFIRVHADVACRIAIAADPTASASSMRLAANATEYLGVTPNLRLAAITTT